MARWKRIGREFKRGDELPPVNLQKIDDLLFVVDGNHRVRVARYHRLEWVDADATDFRSCMKPALQRPKPARFGPLGAERNVVPIPTMTGLAGPLSRQTCVGDGSPNYPRPTQPVSTVTGG